MDGHAERWQILRAEHKGEMMAANVITNLHLPAHIHARLKKEATDAGITMGAVVTTAVTAYLKAKRDGISYDSALSMNLPVNSEAQEKRRALLAVAQDRSKSIRMRVEAYIEARHTIPEDLVDEARSGFFDDPSAAIGRDDPHYEEGETLLYIPPGLDRYRLTREYWFDMELLTDPEVQKKYVDYNIGIGKDELAVRQRLAQILENPPTETESGVEYYARIHKISLEEAAGRIARNE